MVNAHNKRGTAGSTLLREWPMARQGESFEVPAAPLWAALCAQGGIHLVRLPAWQCHAWPPVQVLLAGHSARQAARCSQAFSPPAWLHAGAASRPCPCAQRCAVHPWPRGLPAGAGRHSHGSHRHLAVAHVRPQRSRGAGHTCARGAERCAPSSGAVPCPVHVTLPVPPGTALPARAGAAVRCHAAGTMRCRQGLSAAVHTPLLVCMPMPPAPAVSTAPCMYQRYALTLRAAHSCCPAAALESGISGGTLQGPAHSVAISTRNPGRPPILAALQRRGIWLPNHDFIVARGGGIAVAVEEFWAHLWDAGGPLLVS